MKKNDTELFLPVNEQETANVMEQNFIDAGKTANISRVISPTDDAESMLYAKMLYSVGTNQLTSINTRSNKPIIDPITGNATIEQGTLRVFTDGYKDLKGYRISTHKLLDICQMILSRQNQHKKTDVINQTVAISIDDYMALCGIPLTKPSRDKTRRKVSEDLMTLFHTAIEWTEHSNGKDRDFAKMRICESVSIKKGIITFEFTQAAARSLVNSYIMQYPLQLLQVDERNPNLYHMGKKLFQYHSMDNNIKHGTYNIISVKALLAACPDIPTYDNVHTSGRQLEQRIMQPFTATLDALDFIKWEFCNAKKAPLTDEQIEQLDYNTFINLYVYFVAKGNPNAERIQKLTSSDRGNRADKRGK